MFFALFLLLPSPGAAQTITFTSATASWFNAQATPGPAAGAPVITNGAPTSSIRWGIPVGGGPQSGYDVTITIPDPTQFPVADFSHLNFPVNDPSLTSVQLDIVLDFEVDGAQTGPLTFTFTFTHEETPNNQDPCPYPTPPGEGCTDRVTFLEVPDPTTFTVGGKTYTLGMEFLDASGDPVDEFITSEGGVVNTADLDVEFELVPPVLEVTKSGPGTMILGAPGVFSIDVVNTGPNVAWNATLLDVLPDGATTGDPGGMCGSTPQVLSAEVFDAGGVGKGPLQAGIDFSVSWAAGTCELTLAMLSAASAIGPDERLNVTYQALLDGDTPGGAAFTNVAGAIEWFDDDPSNPDRSAIVRTLSDGTGDHEDAHTVTTDLPEYLFEKTAVDPVSGAPLSTASPGDTIRYRLRLENLTSGPLVGLGFVDEIDLLNASPLFESAPGSLVLLPVPGGADPGGTQPDGGAAGSGLVDVRDLSVAAGESVIVEYDVTLIGVIPNGTLATNQAELLIADVPYSESDDPGVNGPSDPFDPNDQDETVVPIVSAPDLQVEKISDDLTDDPAVLLPGETLQYTITIANVGSDDAVDVAIQDQVPANTSYVPGSTTLNGVAVPDAAGGVSPLVAGILVDAPSAAGTPGLVPADPSSSDPANVATIVFDVVVDPTVAAGTVISNQAFVTTIPGGIVNEPSDDPRTPIVDDPTRNVVGNFPLLFASKDVVLLDDGGTPNIIDPDDTLQYTITIVNSGATPATNAVLQDTIPANTTYVPGTTTLNGVVVPDGGSFPLAAGLPVSSPDVPPPLPAAGQGVISGGETAVVVFVLQVNSLTPPGTLIANQATLTTDEAPDLPTDGDGDPSTGPEPTVVVVGDTQVVTITKQVSVVGGGPVLAGSTLEYVVQVTNVASVPVTDVVITDDLVPVAPPHLTYVPGSATLNGLAAGVNDGGGAFLTADYGATYGPLPPGGIVVLRFQAVIDATLPIGTTVTNTGVVTWNTTETDSASVSVVVGATGVDYLFEKTVVDPVSGAPLSTASPGDTIRYRLRFENRMPGPIVGIGFVDEIDLLNASPLFESAPGSLVLLPVPGGADPGGTQPDGGAAGSGLVDVRDLSVAAGESVIVEYDVTLIGVIPNGTLATNQAELLIGDVPLGESDDPGVNGPSDPFDPNDQDETVVQIVSAPLLQVEKVSDDLTGDPNVLLAGETLEYTITVVNVGSDDAIDVTLRDAVPSNTAYVPGSTTLNGTPVPDGAGGVAPLAAGILINAPSTAGTPGSMPADPLLADLLNTTATIVFQVVVDPSAPDGTIISNQGFVTSVPGGIIDDPSDDPDTPTVDDPTRDVVGDLPLLFAAKDVVLIDNGTTPGIVEQGDTLRYTITITNSGAVPATDVVLQDDVPTHTTYDPGTTTLNTEPVPDGGGGSFPLIPGLPISGDDLTPPIPGAGLGTINPLQTATLVYDLTVAGTATPGTLISNQATVSTVELPNVLTDGDGNPSTGPEPTVVVVGGGQALAITKQVSVVGGGPVLAGSVLEYVVTVANISTVDATGVVITDDLDDPAMGHLAFVAGSATLNGSPAGVDESGLPVLVADYSSPYGPLPPGGTAVLRFRATVAGLPIGTTVTNIATVTWNTTQMETASVSVDVGGMPGVGMLNGRAWHDADFDDVFDGTGVELELVGWSVELYRNGGLVQAATTAADGTWQIGGLAPNDLSGDQYEIRFVAPGAGASTAPLGLASSIFTNGLQQISDIIVPSGSNLQDLNLPIDPNGVVYDALVRTPVAGATLTLLGAGGTPIPSTCFDDPAQQGQITTAAGYYKFDLNFFDGVACPDGDYVIGVVPPGGGAAVVSQLIPPTTDATTAPYSVPICPSDAVGITGECEAQIQEMAPISGAPTTYYLHLTLDDDAPPATSQIFNNHIAVDPTLNGDVAITKTTPKVNVSLGQLVPYEITVFNNLGAPIPDVIIEDRFPAGFRYVDGSARIDGTPTEPTVNGRELRWTGVTLDASSSHTIVLLLAVGAGVSDGEYVNRAQVLSSTEVELSGVATATVRVVPDPTFACTDVMGKVFDDANRNGIQDAGEQGLAGVRLVTARGLAATTDAYGRYHFTCAATPNDTRGSNFILKLDDRTLPTGYRMSNRPTQVKRATAGKALRFNYSASIHRVVSLDMADPVFEPGTTEMRAQWVPRLSLLMEQLEQGPCVLRLSYLADVEDEALVERRLESVKKEIEARWNDLAGDYTLTIEPEVFWRRGGPPPQLPVKRAEEAP